MDLRLSQSSVAALAEEHRPPGIWTTLAGLARGDWGSSISLNRPVGKLVRERAGVTVRTLGAGLALAWSAAAVFCLAPVWLRRRHLDLAVTIAAGGLLCLPAAAVAVLAMYAGAGPAAALAVVMFPRVVRYARHILNACLRRPHVLAARSRGISAGALVMGHVCLPAAPELLALAGISVGMAAGAVIPVEALCDSPGIGQLVWQAAMARDVPVLVPLTMLAAAITCAANVAADAGRALACRWA
jgi:peptide/nickel transport system permease protein